MRRTSLPLSVLIVSLVAAFAVGGLVFYLVMPKDTALETTTTLSSVTSIESTTQIPLATVTATTTETTIAPTTTIETIEAATETTAKPTPKPTARPTAKPTAKPTTVATTVATTTAPAFTYKVTNEDGVAPAGYTMVFIDVTPAGSYNVKYDGKATVDAGGGQYYIVTPKIASANYSSLVTVSK